MMELLKKRREDSEEGFTLIELMVVVLIIAILIAIAVPTFLGAREKAQDRGAQSNLRNGLTAAKTLYVDSNTYIGMTATDLAGVEPSLSFVGTTVPANSSSNTVAFAVSGTAPTDQIILTAYSKSGKCFYIKQVANAAAQFGKGDATSGACATSDSGFTYGSSF